MWNAINGASNEIVGGIVVAALFGLLGWVYKRYKALKEEYARTEQEIERMKEETSRIGATKEEHERLTAELQRRDEELRQVKANSQEDSMRIKKLWGQVSDAEGQHSEDLRRNEALQGQLEATQAELRRKNEALRQAEAKSHEASQQIEALQSELQRKDEALRQAEAKSHEATRQIEATQQELQLEKAKPKLPPISDTEFIELCKSGYAPTVEAVIMNGANVNAKDKGGRTALIFAARSCHTETAELLLKHGADVNARNKDGWTA